MHFIALIHGFNGVGSFIKENSAVYRITHSSSIYFYQPKNVFGERDITDLQLVNRELIFYIYGRTKQLKFLTE